MSTWTFRGLLASLGVLGLSLAACGEGGDGFLGTSSSNGFDNSRRDQALPGAELANGALALVPPPGYCVDKGSLEPSFAILARCDSLGARRAVPDAPLGMIVVSVVQASGASQGLTEALAGFAPQGSEQLERRATDEFSLMRLRGATPEGADPRHWRGLARIGPNLVSVAAFAPTGSELSSAAGGRVLEILLRRSREASEDRPMTVALQ